jgi:hypothetical protein
LIAFSFSCKEKKPDTSQPVLYPNKDSPLALLMREMYTDLEEMKTSVVKGEAIKNYLNKHNGLITAKATDPSVKDISFELMSKGYLESLRNLESSSPQLLLDHYRILHSYCIACHEKHCPGPINKIKKLQLD